MTEYLVFLDLIIKTSGHATREEALSIMRDAIHEHFPTAQISGAYVCIAEKPNPEEKLTRAEWEAECRACPRVEELQKQFERRDEKL